ncbi:nucleotidyltransferase family protein [Pontiella desulfatans]|uniref:nucleotidyltransferase family protein n=1 Tax=Pontiella desulfatans TaxID=2750659 RepID=UPI0014439B85|nr:NDP-sugar synthase [Pontiella desulfatans]
MLNTSTACAWAEPFGDVPWPMLPVANRPLLDYWLEACTDQGIKSVQLILGGDEAKAIEDFVRNGDRWNVDVQYIFARPSESPAGYLRSISALCRDGLFYLGHPFFMRRRQAFSPSGFKALDACRHDFHGEIHFLFSSTGNGVEALLEGQPGSGHGLEQIHLHPFAIDSAAAYFDLNMKMIAGEFSRYVTAGFSANDGSSIGYNVRTPPSSHLVAPIMVGDDCRFGAMTTVGANAVVGNHVIVDAHSELADCLVLDDTYIGRNLEIRNKIVAGNRVIDPSDGTMVQIDDSWLIARNRTETRTEDLLRYVILWFVALGLALVQVVPFCILYPIVKLIRVGRFSLESFHDPRTGYIKLPVFRKVLNKKSVAYRLFRSFSLDRFPWILLVLRGRLFLCGQPPMRHPEDGEIVKQLRQYYPGVFCYQDYNKESDRLIDSLWYAHIRSLYEDLKILIKALLTRFLSAGRQ